jgi:hypothetical protein
MGHSVDRTRDPEHTSCIGYDSEEYAYTDLSVGDVDAVAGMQWLSCSTSFREWVCWLSTIHLCLGRYMICRTHWPEHGTRGC